MDLIYVFVSKDDYQLEQECNKLIESLDVDPFNVTRYNFTDCEPLEIINELQTMSLLGDKKVVVITYPEFLSSSYKKEDIKERFMAYFEYPNPDSYLIILSHDELDKSNLGVSLKLHAKVKKIEDLTGDNLTDHIINEFIKDGYKIDMTSVSEIITRCGSDILLIHNEIDKLKLYTLDTKRINLQIIQTIVPRNLDDNIYDLLQAFIAGDKRKLLSIYDDFMTLNQDEIYIMNSISSKLEEIYYTKVLMHQGLGKDEIASYYRVKPGRAYYMMENAKSLSDDVLIDLIKKITTLDYNIKSGKMDKKLGLQLFILGA